MKKLLLLLLTTFSLSSCNKDDDNPQTLPPATQTGAGTFACYVNGKPFIDTSGGFFNCFYQLVDGEYYFGIQGSDTVGMVTSLGMGTNKKQIEEGLTYQLIEPTDGNANGVAGITQSISSGTNSYTDMQYKGEFTITKLNFINNIVSGTFWFDVKNPYTNETVEIREGRFDTFFTQ
jgi:hypothetical protein